MTSLPGATGALALLTRPLDRRSRRNAWAGLADMAAHARARREAETAVRAAITRAAQPRTEAQRAAARG